jgi:hypothetical protein
MQPLEPLSRPATPQRREPANMYLDPTDRPLSAGEIFALFILGLTFVACLALVVTVSLTRGDYTADLGLPLEKSMPAIEATPDQELRGSPPPGNAAPSLPSPPDIPPVPRSLSSAPPTWL